MTIPTVQFSPNGLIALTRAELAYLQTYLDAGDRGGFYAAYYNITGNSQALDNRNSRKIKPMLRVPLTSTN